MGKWFAMRWSEGLSDNKKSRSMSGFLNVYWLDNQYFIMSMRSTMRFE